MRTGGPSALSCGPHPIFTQVAKEFRAASEGKAYRRLLPQLEDGTHQTKDPEPSATVVPDQQWDPRRYGSPARSALIMTRIEEPDSASAAVSGLANPRMASGTATIL
jgi:hypothetical protein